MSKLSHILINDRIQMELKKKISFIFIVSYSIYSSILEPNVQKKCAFLLIKMLLWIHGHQDIYKLDVVFSVMGKDTTFSCFLLSNGKMAKGVCGEGCWVRSQWFFSQLALWFYISPYYPDRLGCCHNILLTSHLQPLSSPYSTLNIWILASPFFPCSGVI